MANNIEELIIRLNDQVTSRLNGISNSLNGVRNSAAGANGGMSKLGISGGMVGAAIAAGAAVAIGAIYKIGSASLDTAIKVDGIKRQLDFALGGAKEMGDMWEYVKKRSDEMGTSFETNIENISRIGAATKGLINRDELKTIYEGSSQAAAAFSLSQERVNLIYGAFSQMIGKGTVSMEELRGQLGDSLPGAMQTASEAMKMNQKDLQKLIEQGKISGKEFVLAFNTRAIEKYGELAEKASHSTQANFTRVANTLFHIKTLIGDKISPAISDLAVRINHVLGFMEQNSNKIKEVFAPLINYIKNLGVTFKEAFKNAFSDVSLRDVFNRIGTFFKNIEPWLKFILGYYKLIAKGIAWIVRGLYEAFHIIGALIKGFVTLWQSTFDVIKKVLKGIWSVVKPVFDSIYGFLKDKITPLFTGVKSFFSDLFEFVKGIAGTILKLIEKIPILGNTVKAVKDGLKTQEFIKEKVKMPSVFDKMKALTTDDAKSVWTPSKDKNTDLGSNVDSISGSAPKVINISIDKIFSGGIEITTNTFGESIIKIKEELTKALLASINDVNLIGG